MRNNTFISIAIGLFLLPLASFGFSFTANSTTETCNGNGTISLTSYDTDPNGTLVYFIYKLPNLTTPLATISTNLISGLTHGDYKIIAKETVGNNVNTKEINTSISSNIIPLSYTISSINSDCSNFRDISVNVNSGAATGYEIFSGPITFPLQTSNNFSSLPIGEYQIRVFDSCGNGVVTTYIVAMSPTALIIGGQKITQACNSVTTSHTLTPTTGRTISYPLIVTYTTTPPNNGMILTDVNIIPSGDPYSVELTKSLPMFLNETYIYNVSITDNCGNTSSKDFQLNGVIKVEGVITLKNCSSSIINIQSTNFTPPYTLNFTSYPTDFQPSVANGSFIANTINLGVGTAGSYSVSITDACGRTASTSFDIDVTFENLGLEKQLRPGCQLDKGSLKLYSKNAKLTSIIITSAPASFPYSLPYDGSNNLYNGIFYMNNLYPGDYAFNCIDECNVPNSILVTVTGYKIIKSLVSLKANCGSFDIPLKFTSNAIALQSFWLQKIVNASSNTWGHPLTNEAYTENSVPNATNSIILTNNTTNYNFAINGTFRVVRVFYTFNNGSDVKNGIVNSTDKSCIEILAPILTFNQAIELVDIYRLPCSSQNNLDVVVLANGSGSITYKIIKKDGNPFEINNGTSNVFSNLPPATYTFQIEDSCGNSIPRLFDVSRIVSIVNINTPSDLRKCSENVATETFDLTDQTNQILGNQSPNDYTVTYFTTLLDAQNNVNAISNPTTFHPNTNTKQIFARLIFNLFPNCYETTSFYLITNSSPKIKLNNSYTSCSSEPITLDASLNNLPTTTYLWSTGETTPKITVSNYGENHITVTVTNVTENSICINTKNITVFISTLPKINRVETVDFENEENSITVYTANTGEFEYSIDGLNFQDDNYFTNLITGPYTVFVKDKKGCGVVSQNIFILNYPKFFTPNGDGYNDTWQIKNLDNEPNYTISISDRYGNLIRDINAKSSSWDGTHNGSQLTSDDYWFTFYRQDGTLYKGHFTLKR